MYLYPKSTCMYNYPHVNQGNEKNYLTSLPEALRCLFTDLVGRVGPVSSGEDVLTDLVRGVGPVSSGEVVLTDLVRRVGPVSSGEDDEPLLGVVQRHWRRQASLIVYWCLTALMEYKYAFITTHKGLDWTMIKLENHLYMTHFNCINSLAQYEVYLVCLCWTVVEVFLLTVVVGRVVGNTVGVRIIHITSYSRHFLELRK